MKPNDSQEDNKNKNIKYWILILVCFTAMGRYICIEIPGLLKEQIIQYLQKGVLKYSEGEMQYSLIQSTYSLPNIILPLIGGYICDRIGERRTQILSTISSVLGQAIVVIGFGWNSIWIILVGRLIFGISETQDVSITIFITKWFNNHQLTFANSIFLSSLRIAALFSALIIPKYSTIYGLFNIFLFSFLTTIFGLIISYILIYYDEHYSYLIQNSQPITKNKTRAYSLPFEFWILTLITMIMQICSQSFINFISGIIAEDFLDQTNSLEHNQELAAELISILFIMVTVFSPIFGFMVDLIGQRLNILLISSILFLISFILLIHRFLILGLILIGITDALIGQSIWTVFVYMIPADQMGLAVGILTSALNVGLTISPIIITIIKTNYGSNFYVYIFFIINSIVSIFLSILFLYRDQRRYLSLNSHDQVALLQYLELQINYKSTISNNEEANILLNNEIK